MHIYEVQKPSALKLPVVLSVPHAGTFIPPDIQLELKPHLLPPNDTDWFVDQLYSFANDLGIPLIKANYSRWVIDLNRNPDDAPLYTDGRVITALCTATDFLSNRVYEDERQKVDAAEVARRKLLYFTPYHDALQSLLNETKQQFGAALLWDCHSIRRRVPSIYPQPFPDLILGSADATSAAPQLIETVLGSLRNSAYSISHNHPFKGGYITRHYGQPHLHQHALQLEMAKPLYMDNEEKNYDVLRAKDIQTLLIQTLRSAARQLNLVHKT